MKQVGHRWRSIHGMKGRGIAIWALIVLASLIAVVSVLTAWVDRQMLDTASWKAASADLIEDPQVRDAVSVYLVNELYDKVDLSGDLAERLPPNLKPLAGTAAGALRKPLTDAVERVLEAPRVQQLWVEASTLAQSKLVNVIEDKTGNGISTGDGVVTLDLGAMLTEVGAQLGLSSTTLDKIPPDAGQITVLESSKLSTAQTVVKTIRVLSVALFALVFALYALAVFLARGRRRAVLRDIGWAVVFVGLVALVARRLSGNLALDQLTTPTSEDAGRRAWLIASSMLAQIGWAAILYGGIVVAGAVLAGPTRYATAVRARLAPVFVHRPGVIWAVVAGAYLVLVIWGPTHALRTAWGIVLLGALLAAGVEALRRSIVRENLAGPPEAGERTNGARVSQAAPAQPASPSP